MFNDGTGKEIFPHSNLSPIRSQTGSLISICQVQELEQVKELFKTLSTVTIFTFKIEFLVCCD